MQEMMQELIDNINRVETLINSIDLEEGEVMILLAFAFTTLSYGIKERIREIGTKKII
jgi:hypothetical protein